MFAKLSRFLPLALIFAAACDSGGDPGDDPQIDLQPALSNIGTNVIVPTYLDLSEAAARLESEIATLVSAPTDAQLKVARDAWIDSRAPWESSEGFLFGPVDKFGLDPSLDTWPVDEIIIQSILDGSAPITPEFVANQDVDSGLKGFHVIEFLLFGKDGTKSASDLTDRELDYLSAAGHVLESDASKLHSSWAPSGDNFLANILEAGEEGSQFVSTKDALLTLADALVAIADEVGAGKMQGPMDEGALQVESRFSGNSKSDFQNNIRSIRNIYNGDYGDHSGVGITDIAKQVDAALDSEVQSGITAAIAAIGDINGEFRTAITDSRASVESAISAVLELKISLEKLIASLGTNL